MGNKNALVIGVSEYQSESGLNPLIHPVHDADGMRKVLTKLGFDVKFLYDPTRQKMYDKVDEFISLIKRYPGTALFYYSGHGIQYKEKNYLIPLDVRLTQAKDVERNAISLDSDILDEIYESGSDCNIVILDACRNNPFIEEGKKSAGTKGGLAIIKKPPKGTIICYSTAPGTVAYDGKKEDKYGVYTASLIENIEKENISIMDMLTHVRNEVHENTNRLQVTWESNSLFRPFYFNPGIISKPTDSLEFKKSQYAKALKHVYADRVVTVEERESLNEEIAELEISNEQAIAWEKEYRKRIGLPEEIPADKTNVDRIQKSGEIEKFVIETKGKHNDDDWKDFYKFIQEEYGKIEDYQLGNLVEDYKQAYLKEQSRIELEERKLREDAERKQKEELEQKRKADELKKQDDARKERERIEQEQERIKAQQKVEAEQKEKIRIENDRKAELEKKKQEEKGKEIPKTFTNSIGMEFVLIPAGEFMMGASPDDTDAGDKEKPQHKVRITRPFYMSKYEVTIKEYMVFANETKSNFPEYFDVGSEYNFETGKKKEYYKKFIDDENKPIVGVSWNNAKAYTEWLKKKEAKVYRLPTEAEWEYAARAGTTTKYYWGNEIDDAYLWYDGNSKQTTHPVGQKEPNSFGLYDISGNVEELTCDWYGNEYYSKSPSNDPTGLESGSYRVLRGGSWLSLARSCRSSCRKVDEPDNRFITYGFRVVLLP